MTAEERETVIQFDDASPTATVFTCHKAWANALIRRKIRPTSAAKNAQGRPICWLFEVPREWIPLPRPPRKMSEESRRKAGARLKSLSRRGKSEAI